MLKNPQKALAPNSRICAATLGINADCALKAHRKATEREGRLVAESPSNFRRRLCVPTEIVIDHKIRVFQHNRRKADVTGFRSEGALGGKHSVDLTENYL
jgi:hypothetical protein